MEALTEEGVAKPYIETLAMIQEKARAKVHNSTQRILEIPN